MYKEELVRSIYIPRIFLFCSGFIVYFASKKRLDENSFD